MKRISSVNFLIRAEQICSLSLSTGNVALLPVSGKHACTVHIYVAAGETTRRACGHVSF